MAFRGWPRARLCRWLRSRYNCLWDVLDYSVAIDVGVLVWVICWRKPFRALSRFDDDGAHGRRFPSWRRCHGVLSYPLQISR
uniref:Uncharacterized protein n=1 Tax=Oryza meridionalis TaxID=40149 RepID=A0A0E0CWZ6_9ORYZ